MFVGRLAGELLGRRRGSFDASRSCAVRFRPRDERVNQPDASRSHGTAAVSSGIACSIAASPASIKGFLDLNFRHVPGPIWGVTTTVEVCSRSRETCVWTSSMARRIDFFNAMVVRYPTTWDTRCSGNVRERSTACEITPKGTCWGSSSPAGFEQGPPVVVMPRCSCTGVEKAMVGHGCSCFIHEWLPMHLR